MLSIAFILIFKIDAEEILFKLSRIFSQMEIFTISTAYPSNLMDLNVWLLEYIVIF